jgi:hypothetical protein
MNSGKLVHSNLTFEFNFEKVHRRKRKTRFLRFSSRAAAAHWPRRPRARRATHQHASRRRTRRRRSRAARAGPEVESCVQHIFRSQCTALVRRSSPRHPSRSLAARSCRRAAGHRHRRRARECHNRRLPAGAACRARRGTSSRNFRRSPTWASRPPSPRPAAWASPASSAKRRRHQRERLSPPAAGASGG